MEQIWFLKVKGQGQRERKCKNRFTCISSSKEGRFMSNHDQNKQQPILHASSNTFRQRKCFVLWHLSVSLSVTYHTYLSFSLYWNVIESATPLGTALSVAPCPSVHPFIHPVPPVVLKHESHTRQHKSSERDLDLVGGSQTTWTRHWIGQLRFVLCSLV